MNTQIKQDFVISRMEMIENGKQKIYIRLELGWNVFLLIDENGSISGQGFDWLI